MSFARRNNKGGYYPPVISWDTNSSEEPLEKAKLFNSYFASVFTVDDDSRKLLVVHTVAHPGLSGFQVEVASVEKHLKNLDVSKVTGADGVPAIVLKKCATSLAPTLTNIINLSLRSGKFPIIWKHANVCLIFKKGSKLKVNNYKPVSLLSICSKILERCVFYHIIPVIYLMLHSLQHGFRKGKSINTQLLQV